MNFAVLFERVYVVKRKKRLRCEDTKTRPLFSVDNMKFDWLVFIPVEPLTNIWAKDPVS